MSYDISVGREDFNYTSNIAKLFYDHITASDEGRGGLHELTGKTGRQAAMILADAFNRIKSTKMKLWSHGVTGEPAFCAKYDAPNGWGSAVGGLILLAQIMAACHANPRAKVQVSA